MPLIRASVGDATKHAKNASADIWSIQSGLIELSKLTKNKDIYPGEIDMKINKDPKKSSTVKAILAFQESIKLKNSDGVCEPGRYTINQLNQALGRQNFPVKSSLSAYGTKELKSVFGTLKVKSVTKNKKKVLKLTDDWAKKNLKFVKLPGLQSIPFSWDSKNSSSRMAFHKLAVDQLQNLWTAWEKAGLLRQIISYGGSYNLRYKRGSSTKLSNHAWGTAFDINVAQNGLNKYPAPLGQSGCLRELIGLANEHGFFWGGHFSKRKDGMHFEVAALHKSKKGG